MERTFVLSPSRYRKAPPAGLARYDAVYLGDEFCQNKGPGWEDLRRLRTAYRGKVVLLTSVFTDRNLDVFLKLVERLVRAGETPEIVVNDLGLMDALRREFRGRTRPVLGRLLAQALGILVGAPPAGRPAASEDLGLRGYLKGYTRRCGIKMIEADRPALLEFYGRELGLGVAYHYPLRVLAISRFCPIIKDIREACPRPCQGRHLRMTHPYLKGDIILMGNAYLSPNEAPRSPYITRLVYTPLGRRYSKKDAPSAPAPQPELGLSGAARSGSAGSI